MCTHKHTLCVGRETRKASNIHLTAENQITIKLTLLRCQILYFLPLHYIMRKEKKFWWKETATKGEQKNNCAPSSSGSPGTWCQALVAHGPRLLENRWSMACSFLELQQGKSKAKRNEAQISTSWPALPPQCFIQSSLKSTERSPLISNGFDSEPEGRGKTMEHGRNLTGIMALRGCTELAQSHVCLSNVTLLWIALETCSTQQQPVKRFKIRFNLHIFDREYNRSSRRFVSQIMLFLPPSGIK